MASVTIRSHFGAKGNKTSHFFTFSPSICHEVIRLDAIIFIFWMLSFKPGFSLSSFTFIKLVYSDQIRSDPSLSHVRLFATPWIAARQASLSITNSRSSLSITSIESVMPSSHLILLSPSPLAPNPSQHQSLFQWVNSLHEVAKVLEFQLQHHSFQRNPRADLLQKTLRSLLQHHSSGVVINMV